MKKNIVFLGGIHGTGKGFISQQLCSDIPLQYLSASELIKWSEISKDKKNKAVSDISNTQDRLINALNEICIEGINYLLDGHYCLLNLKMEPTKIDIAIFLKIKPTILLILTADPEIIKERLSNRDNKSYDLSLIKEMQFVEKEYAEEISSKLQVPLYFINDENVNQISNIIKNQL